MSYIDSIGLIMTQPCLAEPGKIIVTGKPSQQLDEVLPYLATLPGIIAWNPEVSSLTFRWPHGFMTLYADKVIITQVQDAAEGIELLAALVEAINAVWEQRSQLIAQTKKKRAPRHLDIWELLPRTNCKLCGEPACLAFAVAVMLQTRDLSECWPLMTDPSLADHRAALEALLG